MQFGKPRARTVLKEKFGPKNSKQQEVVEAMKWAWSTYELCAWGYDEVLPIACKGITRV